MLVFVSATHQLDMIVWQSSFPSKLLPNIHPYCFATRSDRKLKVKLENQCTGSFAPGFNPPDGSGAPDASADDSSEEELDSDFVDHDRLPTSSMKSDETIPNGTFSPFCKSVNCTTSP